MNSDPVDQGSEMAEFLLEVAIKNRGDYVRLKPAGVCYYCTEEVPGQQLFCDLFCSKEYDRLESAKRRAGKG